jgi:hypothetical protein
LSAQARIFGEARWRALTKSQQIIQQAAENRVEYLRLDISRCND